ncbi:MAG: hypothetical protein RL641_199 [Candidatus Parcubacteria bacterium]|jgi:RsiW-degrading membrane proteinase PrsW (M82 family)
MFLNFLQNYPFVLAFILGLTPALVWLWFWLKEDIHPEPARMVTLSFLGGMVAVLFSLPLEKIVYHFFQNNDQISFLLWAIIEEGLKFGFVYFIALRNKMADEPVDDIIYLIISALGFVALENTFFIFSSFDSNFLLSGVGPEKIIDTIISGNLRFLGASLLHTMASAMIGICMALAYYKNAETKKIYTLAGILIAVVLHTAFNLFIINGAPEDIFFIFGTVWAGIVILLLLFEKVKHITAIQT